MFRRVPENILGRVRARDRNLVEDLTLNEIVKIYDELSKQLQIYRNKSESKELRFTNDVHFIRSVVLPEKTVITKKFLVKEDWESLGVKIRYIDYILDLLNYFDKKNDKKGIDAVRDLILREGVDMSDPSVYYFNTSNPYVIKLLIDLNPQITSLIIFAYGIRDNIPLLTDLLSYAKAKISKEYFLKNLYAESIKIKDWDNKLIIAMLDSGIITFEDLYNLVLKYNRSEDIEWANRIIEAQI